MSELLTRRTSATIALIAVAVAFLCSAGAAFAIPGSLPEAQAEQDRIQDELVDARERLATKMQEYVEICQELERVDAEISQIASDQATLDVRLVQAEETFTRRAVEMYRSNRGSMLEMLLTSDSVKDFMTRTYYMVVINERDAHIITDVRQARAENLWLQQSLNNRKTNLTQLQADADQRRKIIEGDVELLEAQAAQAGEDVIALMRQDSGLLLGGTESSGRFNPDTIMSEALFRDTSGATSATVQAFLDKQPGVLKSRSFKDINGKTKTAAEIIADASRAWNVSPKVILVKLQKEQSLLSRRNPSLHTLNWATGYGATDSGRIGKYSGFGKQIWFTAKGLDSWDRRYKPGVSMSIDGNRVNPTNGVTYAFYKYTPHMHGNQSFWNLYWRYFGDPMAGAF